MSKCIVAHFPADAGIRANLAASSLRGHSAGIQGISLLRRQDSFSHSGRLLDGGISAAIPPIQGVLPINRGSGEPVLRVLCADDAENDVTGRLYACGARLVTITAAPGSTPGAGN